MNKFPILALALFAATTMNQAANASSYNSGQVFPVSQHVCLTKNAKLFASSSRQSNVRANLSKGARYKAKGKTGDNRWFKITASGRTGFVRRTAVTTC